MRVLFLFLSLSVIAAACGDASATRADMPAVMVNAAVKGFLLNKGVLYLNGKPFSGKQYTLYPTGDTACITPYFNGREHGVARQWYTNRQVKEIRHYENGHKTGEHTGWWDNGQLQFVYHFNNDVYEGALKEWYANGQLFRQMHYVNGIESGRQQVWQPNGKVFANYDVRNGRNYGLTGTMHCKNYWQQGAPIK